MPSAASRQRARGDREALKRIQSDCGEGVVGLFSAQLVRKLWQPAGGQGPGPDAWRLVRHAQTALEGLPGAAEGPVGCAHGYPSLSRRSAISRCLK